MPISDWRSQETIEQLNRLDRPGFAAELLRRNADYRRDHAQTLRNDRPWRHRSGRSPVEPRPQMGVAVLSTILTFPPPTSRSSGFPSILQAR